MDFFMILQIVFDAVLLFGVLFLFHYSVHRDQGKREDEELMKNAQVQEMKESLQELLLTLKQLGKEVSDNIQEEVREAEEKTETLKKIVQKLQRDLSKVTVLAEEVTGEKTRLEEKAKVIQISRRIFPKALPEVPKEEIFGGKEMNPHKSGLEQELGTPKKRNGREGRGMGVSSEAVKEVYRLADRNFGLNEIAKSTKLSRAEIQLILNLRGNRFTTPN